MIISCIKIILYKIISKIKGRKATVIGANVSFHWKSKIILLNGATKHNIRIDSNSNIYGSLTCCATGVISIGKFSQIGENSYIRSVNNVHIGSYTSVADNVVVCDNNNHPVNPLDRHIMQQTPSGSIERSWINSDNTPIIIGDNCWIGQHSRICKSVKIGDGSIVAANSVVTKDVPENCIVAGNPAKIVKTDIHLNTNRYFG